MLQGLCGDVQLVSLMFHQQQRSLLLMLRAMAVSVA